MAWRCGSLAASTSLVDLHTGTVDAMTIPWKDLRRAVEDNDVFVGAGSEHNLSERELEGVVGGHAYSILHAVDVGAAAERVRLLLLRNPWGKSEWKGDWSDSSSCWRKRPDVAAAVGNKRSNEDDGRFWIQLPDFRRRFRSVDLCRVKNGQLKERNVLKEREASDVVDEASDDDDWLAEIPGASRAHDHASKAPKKQSSCKKKSKKKKKHKR